MARPYKAECDFRVRIGSIGCLYESIRKQIIKIEYHRKREGCL